MLKIDPVYKKVLKIEGLVEYLAFMTSIGGWTYEDAQKLLDDPSLFTFQEIFNCRYEAAPVDALAEILKSKGKFFGVKSGKNKKKNKKKKIGQWSPYGMPPQQQMYPQMMSQQPMYPQMMPQMPMYPQMMSQLPMYPQMMRPMPQMIPQYQGVSMQPKTREVNTQING